jgi:hypothetical protein
MALLWLQDLDLIPDPEHLGSGPTKGHVVIRPTSADREPTPGYRVPPGLTLAGRRAYHAVVREYAAQLAQLLETQPHKMHRTDGEHTTIDVYEARQKYQERIVELGRGNRRVLMAVLLLALSIVGIGTTANYLQGLWQAVFLAVFVLVLPAVVGLVLVRIGRPRRG